MAGGFHLYSRRSIVNENEKKTSDWKMIIGGIALIAVLFVGVQFIFWGLGEAIHQDVPDASASRSAPEEGRTDAPSFCVHCGRELPERFEWGQFCPYCGEKVA